MSSNVELNAAPDRVELCSKEDDGFAFHFKLPPDGLALRSVAIVDDVPEMRFDASHKVPTVTEEDLAHSSPTCFGRQSARVFLYYNSFWTSIPRKTVQSVQAAVAARNIGWKNYYSTQTGT